MSESGVEGGIRLVVPATTDSVAIARQLVAGVGDALGLGEFEVADLKLITSEAASNVVRHAYPDDAPEGTGERDGVVEICVSGDSEKISVTVRDDGFGFALAQPSGESLGLGIPLMASVAERLELRVREGGGVELVAEIAVGERRRSREEQTPEQRDREELGEIGGDLAQVTVEGELALQPILARLIGICALRGGLTVDQLADTLIVSDALSAGADVWAGEAMVTLAEGEDERQAALTIGPLVEGGGQKLIDGMEIPGVGSLRKLADDLRVEVRNGDAPGEAGEYLTMLVAAPSDD